MPPTRVRPPLRRVARGNDSGFTTVEALVAFTLLAIVAAGAATATVSATTTAKTTSDRAVAANLAQRDLQSARTLRFPDYPQASAPRAIAVNGTTYTLSRSVTATRPDGSTIGACPATPDFTNRPYMVITTTVTWPPARTNDRVVVATELAC